MLGVYALVVAVVLLALGVYVLRLSRRDSPELQAFHARAVPVQAQVLELRRRVSYRHDGPNEVYRAALLRFPLPDGRIVEAESMGASKLAPAQPGETVAVRYDPQDPTRVDLAEGRGRARSQSCALTGLGVLLCFVGVVLVMFTVFVTVVLRMMS